MKRVAGGGMNGKRQGLHQRSAGGKGGLWKRRVAVRGEKKGTRVLRTVEKNVIKKGGRTIQIWVTSLLGKTLGGEGTDFLGGRLWVDWGPNKKSFKKKKTRAKRGRAHTLCYEGPGRVGGSWVFLSETGKRWTEFWALSVWEIVRLDAG